MSSGSKIPLARAERIAARAVELLSPICASVAVAGSVRRRKDLVGDIELVIEPMMTAGLFGGEPDLDAIRSVVASWGEVVRNGERQIAIQTTSGKIELYLVYPPAQLGSILAIRTGPAELGKQAMQGLIRRGYRHHDGHVEKAPHWEVVPTPTEEAFFFLAGLPCLPPEKRGGPPAVG